MIQQVHSLLNTGYTQVVDADLAAYFDSIPHSRTDEVGGATDRRSARAASDQDVAGSTGRGNRRAGWKEARAGIVMRSAVSHRVRRSRHCSRTCTCDGSCWGGSEKVLKQRLKARIVTYADDLVICCKGSAAQALEAMRSMMTQIKLTVNEEKTRVCRVPNETFDFLGYTFGRCYSEATGKAYLGTRPSKKSVKRLIAAIHEQTTGKSCQLEADEVVQTLNRKLRGWANYFKLGPVSKAYRAVDLYTTMRLRWWLRKKHQIRSGGNRPVSQPVSL